MLAYAQKASPPLPSPLPASMGTPRPVTFRGGQEAMGREGQRNGRDAPLPPTPEREDGTAPLTGSFAEGVCQGQTIQTREGEVLT